MFIREPFANDLAHMVNEWTVHLIYFNFIFYILQKEDNNIGIICYSWATLQEKKYCQYITHYLFIEIYHDIFDIFFN